MRSTFVVVSLVSLLFLASGDEPVSAGDVFDSRGVNYVENMLQSGCPVCGGAIERIIVTPVYGGREFETQYTCGLTRKIVYNYPDDSSTGWVYGYSCSEGGDNNPN